MDTSHPGDEPGIDHVDLTQMQREVERTLDKSVSKAFRAIMVVIRRNTARLDALEAWRRALEAERTAAQTRRP